MSAPARALPFFAGGRWPSRPRIARPNWGVVLLVALIALAPPAYLAQTGGALTTGYTIQRLQGERNAWRVRNQQLELELAKARSLAWVETEAVTRLGMRRPDRQTVVAIDAPIPATRPAPAERLAHQRPAQADADTPATSWSDGFARLVAALLGGR